MAGAHRVKANANGPLLVLGPAEVELVSGEVRRFQEGGRVLLCRCGGSRQKPACDWTHFVNGFKDGTAGAPDAAAQAPSDRADDRDDGPLKARVTRDGPIEIEGPFELETGAGAVRRFAEGKRVRFCRCGRSSKHPFCDSTHEAIGFTDPTDAA